MCTQCVPAGNQAGTAPLERTAAQDKCVVLPTLHLPAILAGAALERQSLLCNDTALS